MKIYESTKREQRGAGKAYMCSFESSARRIDCVVRIDIKYYYATVKSEI